MSVCLSLFIPITFFVFLFVLAREKRREREGGRKRGRERREKMSNWSLFDVLLQLLFAESFPASSSVSEFGSAQRLCTKRVSSLTVVLASWLLCTLLSVNKTLICMEILKSECIVILDFHILYLPELQFYSCQFPNEMFYVFPTGINFRYLITFKAVSELKL